MFKHKKAQSLNEYAMMIVLITLLAIGLQNYVKLGVQSVLKTTADNLATGGEMDKTSVPSVNSIAFKK